MNQSFENEIQPVTATELLGLEETGVAPIEVTWGEGQATDERINNFLDSQLSKLAMAGITLEDL